MCYRSIPIVCASINGSSAFHFQPDCRCWACKTCRPKLIAYHLDRLRALFRESATIYVVTGAREDWGATVTRMRRAFVHWICIRPGDGTWIAYCDGDVIPGGKWLTVPRGLTHATQTLNRVSKPDGCLRFIHVTCCAAWRAFKQASKVFFLGWATANSFTRAVKEIGSKAVEVIRKGLTILRAPLDCVMADKLFDHFGCSDLLEFKRSNDDISAGFWIESSSCEAVPCLSG